MAEEQLLKPTNYKDIKDYSKNLKNFLEKNAHPFDLEKFPFYIEMDIASDEEGLGRLRYLLSCKKLLCVLGLGKNKETNKLEFKVSFLGLDETNEIDKRHLPQTTAEDKRGIDGEETWPRMIYEYNKIKWL